MLPTVWVNTSGADVLFYAGGSSQRIGTDLQGLCTGTHFCAKG
jgi:hypothetical protein